MGIRGRVLSRTTFVPSVVPFGAFRIFVRGTAIGARYPDRAAALSHALPLLRPGSRPFPRKVTPGVKKRRAAYIVYTRPARPPVCTSALLPAEGPGRRTEDISRCRPTYHSFAARRGTARPDTARQHSQIKERQSPRRARARVRRYGAIALHKTSLARWKVDVRPCPAGEKEGGR